MNNRISKRCGKSTCKHYDKHNPISGCFIYNDRTLCTMSISHRNKVTKISQERGTTANWFNY